MWDVCTVGGIDTLSRFSRRSADLWRVTVRAQKSPSSPDGPQGHKKTAHEGRSGVMSPWRSSITAGAARSGHTAPQARYHLPHTV
nr:MAG TPA: hypothetical protein [Caudoviricetes sp.]